MNAEAFWVVGREQGEIRTESLHAPGEGEVLVETLFSAVSRGTELLVYRGLVPTTEYERMRAPHQAGAYPWPIKYGYSNVGIVREGNAALIGKPVFCLFPHQTRYVVATEAVVPVPGDVPPARAILAANLETALNAVWDAGLSAGDRVSVVGAGVVGALVAHLAARHPGTEVTLVDVDPAKEHIARALGVDFSSPNAARGGADLVVHASGAPEGLETALSLAGREATVLELSWHGQARVALTLGAAFHSQRLRIQSSQVGQLPARQQARWDFRRRLALALSLLDDARLDVLVTGESPFETLPQVMADLSAGAAGCRRITYR